MDSSVSAYDSVLRLRGAVTQRQLFLRSVRNASPELKPAIEALQQTSREMTALSTAPYDPKSKIDRPTEMAKLEAKRLEQEADLARKSDAFAAYQWALQNAASLNASNTRVAVVGESAGGNLACNVSLMARDKKLTVPKVQVLVYPVAQADMNTPSYRKNAAAKPLDKPMMAWFAKNYFRTPADGQDPRISLVKANLKGLPPTTIIGAEIDPLASDGRMLADQLEAAGVTVKYQLYPGVTHEFFGMSAVLPEAREAQALAAEQLKAGLAQ